MVAAPSLFRGCLDRNASSSMTQRWHGPIKTALNDEAILNKTVDEIMTTGRIVTCSPDTSLDDALELIVEHHVTGLPVVDEENRVVGIISDFDLLALEGVSEEEKTGGLFPTADKDWNSFFEVQKLVEKNAGTTVSDVMTTDPVCVRALTSIPSAAHLLLHKRIRRLPVTDDEGRLIGIITRSNIIKAAWESRKTKQV
ncbi:hypothetical protein M9435_004732 [Picochlorum sp. BPE23]|nr:hypothetical protein M9435_004732 [Picochlorum sp. BPE23]